ncbi:Type II secretion system protein E [Sporomusa rhizae]|uniref:GspE/PulE family protein n=1 Tax=Sporomusa rhizae TaxID=357999 RepID=UPI00352A90B8
MLHDYKKLGDLLIQAKLLTPDQLKKALIIQKQNGERLDKVLISLGLITESNIVQIMEFQLGIPHIDLINFSIDKDMAAVIPASLAERYQLIPVQKTDQKLTLAMADPMNFFAIDDARMVSGCEIEPVIAAESEIMRAISHLYGVNELVEKAVNKLKPEEVNAISPVQTTDDAPIIGIVNSLISQAVREWASDIHVEPQDKMLRVRFRIDGVLREVASFTRDVHAAIVSRIKIMGDMDISEKRLPQEGRINVVEQGRQIDIRVSTLPTILGEKVVLRILDKKAVILDINKLGFGETNLTRYRHLYSQAYGMILISGPTGSGKTTTLYSTLSNVNTIEKNTITIEDPVEYRLEGINQVQVNPKAGLTFASGLRSILRQDPNIVMIGEIRDGETADIAIRAAMTGHLVLSTLHTNDAAGAITRLVDMGIESFLVASSVLGVIAQRLVRVICPECKKACTPSETSLERLFLGVTTDQPIKVYKGTGCANCAFTGYRGRIGIHEVMPISLPIRRLINERASAGEIAVAATREGMVSMREDGIKKVLNGITTIDEVMRVSYTSL